MTATAVVGEKARHLIAVKRWAEARSLLADALAVAPDAADLNALMAQALLEDPASRGPGTDALRFAERACALDPMSASHHRLRALAHQDRREFLDAYRAAQEAVRLQPNSWINYVTLSGVAIRLRRGRRTSRRAAQRAVELAPHLAGPHFAVGLAAHAAGRHRAARAAYRRALQLDPQHSPAHNNLGTLAGLRRGKAAAQFLRAARVNPYDTVAVGNLRAEPTWLWVALLLTCCVGLDVATLLNSHGNRGTAMAVGICIPLVWAVWAAVVVRGWPSDVRRALVAGSIWRRPLYAGTLGAVVLVLATQAVCFLPQLDHALFGRGSPTVGAGVLGGLLARHHLRRRRLR